MCIPVNDDDEEGATQRHGFDRWDFVFIILLRLMMMMTNSLVMISCQLDLLGETGTLVM